MTKKIIISMVAAMMLLAAEAQTGDSTDSW
jgi:hypothetical protein